MTTQTTDLLSQPVQSRVRAYRPADALAAVLLLAAVVGLQAAGKVYTSELAGYSDEPAHYVTGLMVRDYLLSGFHQGPMSFAQEYYEHYPKVAIGNWPPMFYAVQAGWSLLMGTDARSLMLMMGALTAAVAWMLYRLAAGEYGRARGLLGAMLFVSIPLVQQSAGMLMMEVLIALLTLGAMLQFGRFLDRGQTKDALGFGVLAALAVLTKGSGMQLALVPPVAILVCRRWDLLKRPALWAAAAVVVALAGPWTLAFYKVVRISWVQDNPSWDYAWEALRFYPPQLVMAVGGGVAILAALGLVDKLTQARRRLPQTGKYAALAGGCIGLLAIHLTVPTGVDQRFLVPMLPAVIFFALAGADALGRLYARWIGAVLLALAVGWFLATVFKVPLKDYRGFESLALQLADDTTRPTLLISSDARGEGQFIAEMAMHEKRPGHVIRRCSKVLAVSSWNDFDYQAKAQTPQQMLDLLSQQRIAVVVIDTSIPARLRRAHHTLLEQTILQTPSRFVPLYSGDAWREGKKTRDAIKAYRFKIE